MIYVNVSDFASSRKNFWLEASWFKQTFLNLGDFCNNVNEEVSISGHISLYDWPVSINNLVNIQSLALYEGADLGLTLPHLKRVNTISTYTPIKNMGNLEYIGTHLCLRLENALNIVNVKLINDQNEYLLTYDNFQKKIRIDQW